MYSRYFRTACAAALLLAAGSTPAQAQREIGLFFDFATELIQADQNKRYQQQQQAAAQQATAQQAAQEQAEFFTRAQTALSTLGFYKLAIDGETGPGTRAAIAAYQSAFGLPARFEEPDLYDLEMRAAQGWRSQDEIEAAQAGGFSDRARLIAAQEGSFSNSQDFGRAQQAGFSNAADYEAFLASGASDKAAFEAEQERQAKSAATAEQCLDAVQAQDWSAALGPCHIAVRAGTGDAAVELALNKALEEVEAESLDAKALLATKRDELKTALSGSNTESAAVNALRDEINTLAATALTNDIYLQAARCDDLVGRERWEEAATTCYPEHSVDHLAGAQRGDIDIVLTDMAANLTTAQAGRDAERAATEAEAKRLALVEAKTKANALLDEVTDYSHQGRTFAAAIDVARELVALRGAIEGNDAARIERHVAALDTHLSADADYVATRAAMQVARSEAQQNAALEARRQAQLLDAFILDYVGRNVTSIHVPELLPFSDTLGAVLAEGNAEKITAAQSQIRQSLTRFGLVADFETFASSYGAPEVSADALEVAAAESANASLALDSAVRDSQSLLATIEVFASGGGTFADPIKVARSLAALKSNLAKPVLPDLKVKHDQLAALLSSDAGFAAAQIQRSQTNDAALADAVALAHEQLAVMNAFLLDHIAANLTDDDILDAVDLQMAIETTLAAPASAETVQQLAEAGQRLAAMGLDDALAQAISRQAASERVVDTATTQAGLAITPANKMLLEGDGDDLVVLRSADAPHLVFDLVGNLRVDGGTAMACWVHAPDSQSIAFLMARQRLAELRVDRLSLASCTQLEAAPDLVVLRRADFLALPPSVARPVITAFEDGALKPMVVVTGAEARQETQRYAEQAETLAGTIENGTAVGFGILQVSAGSGGICPVVTDLAAHQQSLAELTDGIAFFIGEPRFVAPMTMDRAFVAAQRGQCSAIYAAAADLQSLTEALTKAETGFSVVPLWVETSAVEAEEARLAAVSAQQIAAAAKRQQQAQAAEALDAARLASLRDEVAARQAALRIEYEERATGKQKDIAELVRTMVASGTSETLQADFPATFDYLARSALDKWTVTGTVDDLADYGTATWQGRRVEAILVRVTVERENAILGLYSTDCLVLGYLVDREFRIDRDPLEAQCSDEAIIADWSSARGFESVWNLPVQ